MIIHLTFNFQNINLKVRKMFLQLKVYIVLYFYFPSNYSVIIDYWLSL